MPDVFSQLFTGMPYLCGVQIGLSLFQFVEKEESPGSIAHRAS